MNLHTINSGETTEVIRTKLNENFSTCFSNSQQVSSNLIDFNNFTSELQRSVLYDLFWSFGSTPISFGSNFVAAAACLSGNGDVWLLNNQNQFCKKPNLGKGGLEDCFSVTHQGTVVNSFCVGSDGILYYLVDNTAYMRLTNGNILPIVGDPILYWMNQPEPFSSIKVSGNGVVIVVGAYTKQLYVSRPAASNMQWNRSEWSCVFVPPNNNDAKAEISYDGNVIVYSQSHGLTYISNDSGYTFNPSSLVVDLLWYGMPHYHPLALAISSDGTKIVASFTGASTSWRKYYISTNSGSSWSEFNTLYGQYVVSLQFSPDGTILGATGADGYQYFTKTLTATWELASSVYSSDSKQQLRWSQFTTDGTSIAILGYSFLTSQQQVAYLGDPSIVLDLLSFVKANSATWDPTIQLNYVNSSFLPISGGVITNQLKSRSDVTISNSLPGSPTFCVGEDGSIGINTSSINNSITVNNGNMYVKGRTVFSAPPTLATSEVPLKTFGNIIKKMEVFDLHGISLGFMPIYDTIT